MAEPVTDRDSVAAELERVLASPVFETAGRSRSLLKFVVEETLSGRADHLKEYTIGAEALDKGPSFDPRTDPIVRAEVSRLRNRLERYYAAEGQTDQVIISLPRGTYIPHFLKRNEKEVETQPAEKPPVATSRFPWFVAATAVVVCAFAAGVIFPWHPARKAERPVTELNVELTSRGPVGGEVGPSIALSPDGTRIAFIVSGADGVPHLHFRRLDRSDETELPGTEGVRGPFFSPDGSWIGFWAAGKLKKTNVDGGSPVVLCDAPDLLGAGWGEDGQIVASFGSPKLFRVSSAGGTPTAILDLSQQMQMPAWPQVLRGGKTVLFTTISSSGPDQSSIESFSFQTGKRTMLIAGGTFGRAFGDSYLTYVNQGTLYAVRYDAEKAQVQGSPLPVLGGVAYSPTFGYAEADFSRTGDLLFRKHRDNDVIAQWIDPSGRGAPMISKPGNYFWPRLSPDRKRLAMSVIDSGETAVNIYESDSESFSRIQLSSAPCLSVWAPNGRFLVMGCRGTIVWVRADGTGKPQPLLEGNTIQVPWSFSPDGSRLAYHELGPSSGLDLWTVPVHATTSGLTAGTPEVFLKTPAFEAYPTFSPDGRWIAYGSNESGTWEVYVRAFPDNGHAVRVSNAGGRIPFFSPSRNELFYRTDSQRIMAATYSVEEGGFVVHSVKQWSPVRLADTGVFANLDLDGRQNRFVGLVTAPGADEDADHHVMFIQNFAERVRMRLASSGR
ncbi:MAG TPA: hypothetical protein VMB19_13075 [Silvibacterium sp.]|nr:hypothetical protein [Silvibacterium sp.]